MSKNLKNLITSKVDVSKLSSSMYSFLDSLNLALHNYFDLSCYYLNNEMKWNEIMKCSKEKKMPIKKLIKNG